MPSKLKHEKGVGNVIVFNLEWRSPKSYYRFELLGLLKALERLLPVGGKDGVRDDSGLHVMKNIDSDIGTLETQTYKLKFKNLIAKSTKKKLLSYKHR